MPKSKLRRPVKFERARTGPDRNLSLDARLAKAAQRGVDSVVSAARQTLEKMKATNNA